MRRVVVPELLDMGTASADDVRKSLDDLQFINRWFGGTRTSISLLDRVATRERRPLSLLDVGSATGDISGQ